jgi:hypothetical protein
MELLEYLSGSGAEESGAWKCTKMYYFMYATPDGNVTQKIIKMIGHAAWGLGAGFKRL